MFLLMDVVNIAARRKQTMINFFTTGCPKCKILKKKMDDKGISYNTVTDIEVMTALGIDSVPVLQFDDGALMDFGQAIKWVNEV